MVTIDGWPEMLQGGISKVILVFSILMILSVWLQRVIEMLVWLLMDPPLFPALTGANPDPIMVF